ncbi:hypothetical protein AAFF_G00081670 [Aldrovandia affinis]|uniref:Uncharacterized protein n=1 Tax=Aldrovandia affinis TaxID=143900 RepID=A0AAD7T3D5_9TELE|nr:hypothetical protein AAFF_G00081670 [Aldrovandia affinis]
METETQDEETLTTSEIVEDGDPGPSMGRPSSSLGDKQGEDIKKVYKTYLLQEIRARQQEMEYRKLKMRKLELEIRKLEKDEKQ